jgi:hypothetical protein
MRHKGKVVLLNNNPVFTSSRRLKKGFLYNFIVTGAGYYVIDYFIGLFTKKSTLGSYQAIRDEQSQKPTLGWQVATVAATAVLVLMLIDSQPTMAHAALRHVHKPNFHYLNMHGHLHRPDIDLPSAS